MNQALLQTVHQQRTDFVGQTIDTAPHLGDEATRKKLKNIYGVSCPSHPKGPLRIYSIKGNVSESVCPT
ncbi:hypothetical protein [Bacillus thuringiensis]|uniref:hypothetical protein n=1 Tax=Bacillus thuringiensis TaxID=1428 RepID=UPI000A37C7CE|nr:hypothetical protein [Bacillus thuringiensis]